MGVGRGVADACDRYKGVRTSAKVRGVRTHAKFFASTQKLSIAMLSSKRSHANLVLSDVRRDEYCISGTWTRNSPFQKGLRGFALRTLCSRNCVPRPPPAALLPGKLPSPTNTNALGGLQQPQNRSEWRGLCLRADPFGEF